MCGRFALAVDAADLAALLPGMVVDEPPRRRWNIAPTQETVVVPNDGRRALARYRWGLVPRWAKEASIGHRMINARAETVAEKPSFKVPLERQRCLVPASGFYEWRKEGTARLPFYFTLASGRPVVFAGLWDSWIDPEGRELRTFTIITTPANEIVATIHDRMPAILPPEAAEAWLEPARTPGAALLPLLAPFASEPMKAVAVSTRVNSPAHDAPDCIEPLG